MCTSHGRIGHMKLNYSYKGSNSTPGATPKIGKTSKKALMVNSPNKEWKTVVLTRKNKSSHSKIPHHTELPQMMSPQVLMSQYFQRHQVNLFLPLILFLLLVKWLLPPHLFLLSLPCIFINKKRIQTLILILTKLLMPINSLF